MGNKNKHKNHRNHFSNRNMEENNKAEGLEQNIAADTEGIANVEPDTEGEGNPQAEVEEACSGAEKEIAELKEQLEKEKKEYLFLMAEFDNFRKRTLREKSEIIKNAGENVLKGLLPIMDDFERGIKAAENTPEADSVKEGVALIYNKFKKYLNQNGVKEIDPADDTFDTEKHEAISVVPVPDEDKKGKILDTVEKGYTINDKVLRHAKVVVGQ